MSVVETTDITTPATTEATPSAVPAEDSKGLDAGFRKVRGEPTEDRPTSPAATEATPAKETATEEVTKPDAQAKEVKEEPVVFGGLTEPQLKAALAKAAEVDELRKSLTDVKKDVLGRVGQLQQALKDLPKTPTAAAPIKVTKDSLKRLRKEGYGELADALEEDFGALLDAPGSTPVDVESISKGVSEKLDARVTDLSREYEMKLVSISHPDWKEIANSDDFKLWRATLSADMQKQLAATWDSVLLTNTFTTFKTWKANGKKAADSAKEAKPAQDKRLAAAVTPRGSQAASPSRLPDEAGLAVGFKKVRGIGHTPLKE
jgi:hypothetical protein